MPLPEDLPDSMKTKISCLFLLLNFFTTILHKIQNVQIHNVMIHRNLYQNRLIHKCMSYKGFSSNGLM